MEKQHDCENLSMEEEFDQAISKEVNYTICGKKSNNSNLLQKEVTLLEEEGTRGKYIQQIFDTLMTIRPTSVEA